MPRGGSRPGAGRPKSAEPPKPKPPKGPHGGARPGAGRKKKLAAPVVAPEPVAHAPDGVKAADAPPAWPFGVMPAQADEPPPAEPPAPTPAPPAAVSAASPLDYLLSVMRDEDADPRIRLQAASNAAPYMHVKPGEVGKKAAKAEAAKSVGSGRFAPAPSPLKLVVR